MAEAAINTERSSQSVCVHCGAQTTGAHFCPDCGKIQPVEEGSDHFGFFSLPRKLRIDESELEKSFYALSRQFHPDYFMSATEAERQASMERSSRLNDAYRILRDRVARVTYLLALEGYKEAEKKAPPDLLEEVFELNMQIEELKAAKKMGDEDEVAEARSALESALAGLRETLAGIDERLLALFEDWDSVLDQDAATDVKKPLLDRMSELLSHRSYVRHLVHNIQEEL
ncbi:MAG TPA: Fe-S protein assembly co-chaperone HscB [Blastocatellia bacterium]|nr:Fe-S protein assembly co-chaperone HscB [Blastocatellia bacterium]